jgi:hypothetical protein
MRVQLADSDRPHAQSAAVRFCGHPAGLLSHADGSDPLATGAQSSPPLSWEEIRLALMLDIGSD